MGAAFDPTEFDCETVELTRYRLAIEIKHDMVALLKGRLQHYRDRNLALVAAYRPIDFGLDDLNRVVALERLISAFSSDRLSYLPLETGGIGA